MPANEISNLLKEQRMLKESEKKIKSMMHSLNLHLNQLLVEELQLKSRDVEQKFDVGAHSASSASCGSLKPLEENQPSSSTEINQQELDLNVHGRHAESEEEEL